MNKTLLLIICDFLLLSLLGFAKFDVDDDTSGQQELSQEESGPAATDSAELIEILELSLEAEQAEREELIDSLNQNEAELALQSRTLMEREDALKEKEKELENTLESLSKLEEEQQQLSTTLTDATIRLSEQQQQLVAKEDTLQQSLTSIEQLTQTAAKLNEEKRKIAEEKEEIRRLKTEAEKTATALQHQLENVSLDKEEISQNLNLTKEEAKQQQRQIAALNKQLSLEKENLRLLQLDYRVAEFEKNTFVQQLESAQEEIEVQREEKKVLQENTTKLANNVSQLAESSSTLEQEVKMLRPKSTNEIFAQFRENNIQVEFIGHYKGILGASIKPYRLQGIVVNDGHQYYVITHSDDTPFSAENQGRNFTNVQCFIETSNGKTEVASVAPHPSDPRLLIIPVPTSFTTVNSLVSFPMSTSPYSYAEAILIDESGKGYGEISFKLDPERRNYFRMHKSFIGRIFGDFSPGSADFVFSKQGEFLGVMVTNYRSFYSSELSLNHTILLGNAYDRTAASNSLKNLYKQDIPFNP